MLTEIPLFTWLTSLKRLVVWVVCTLLLFPEPGHGQYIRQTGITDNITMDIRIMPVNGFYPMTGNIPVTGPQVNTFVAGFCLDMLNWKKAAGDTSGMREQFSLVNISVSLPGLNYTALNAESRASFFNIAYGRFGPHYRFGGLASNNRFAMGVQVGYGILVVGKTAYANASYLTGIDFSFTLSLIPY